MAVTVTVPATPAVVGDGKPATTRLLAAAGLTTMPVCEPVIVYELLMSVAVKDWLPAVLSVPLKVCWPASAAVKV